MATPEQLQELEFHGDSVTNASSMDEAYYEVLAAKEYSGFLQSQKENGLPTSPSLNKMADYNGLKDSLKKLEVDSVIGKLSAQRGRKRLFQPLKVID